MSFRVITKVYKKNARTPGATKLDCENLKSFVSDIFLSPTLLFKNAKYILNVTNRNYRLDAS